MDKRQSLKKGWKRRGLEATGEQVDLMENKLEPNLGLSV